MWRHLPQSEAAGELNVAYIEPLNNRACCPAIHTRSNSPPKLLHTDVPPPHPHAPLPPGFLAYSSSLGELTFGRQWVPTSAGDSVRFWLRRDQVTSPERAVRVCPEKKTSSSGAHTRDGAGLNKSQRLVSRCGCVCFSRQQTETKSASIGGGEGGEKKNLSR